MKRTMITGILLALFTREAFAAEVKTNRVGAGPFGVCSVVYGDVASVTQGPPTGVRLTLNVRCTLTGPYDAAANPVLHSDMLLWGMMWGVIRDAPRVNAQVVVVLWCRPYPLPVPWGIPMNGLGYTPSGAAVVEVQGFDDPKVTEIIARLRDLRAANPLGPWDAAREAIKAESANRKTPEGGDTRPPRGILELLYPPGKEGKSAEQRP